MNYKGDPARIADIFCKKYPDALAKIEDARLMKGKGTPDWPYWCFLPVKCWMLLFMNKPGIAFTHQLWQEILTFSMLGTWRYSKGIYTLHPSVLHALTDTPLSDSLPVDVLLRLPEWCIYVKTPGMQMDGEPLHGFWATVSLEDIHQRRKLELLLNGGNGLRAESLPLKSGTVNVLWEDMFHAGLDSSGAPPEHINLLRQSEYVSALLKRKADNISKLLSILLYICSDEPEIDSERQPGTYPTKPKLVKTKKGFRLFPANGPRYWSVGEKTGRMLAEAQACSLTETTATGRHPRTHLRRGHWHGFWSGKTDVAEARKFSYRWLPPQIIGGRRG